MHYLQPTVQMHGDCISDGLLGPAADTGAPRG
jgi:hypothetical protein